MKLNKPQPRLSIIVPVYNEAPTLPVLIGQLTQLKAQMDCQLIFVDDGSTDGSPYVLRQCASDHRLISHAKNRGKGAAIKSALPYATGTYTVIQDADLEYDPRDLLTMLAHVEATKGTVLFGARPRRLLPLSQAHYYLGRISLTAIANILFNQRLTDEATCYKMFATPFLQSLPLSAERFDFCPEVIALTAQRKITIPEIPISYFPRSPKEGKKIRARDWFSAAFTLLRYRFTFSEVHPPSIPSPLSAADITLGVRKPKSSIKVKNLL